MNRARLSSTAATHTLSPSPSPRQDSAQNEEEEEELEEDYSVQLTSAWTCFYDIICSTFRLNFEGIRINRPRDEIMILIKNYD